jgi:hypothetical protein
LKIESSRARPVSARALEIAPALRLADLDVTDLRERSMVAPSGGRMRASVRAAT